MNAAATLSLPLNTNPLNANPLSAVPHRNLQANQATAVREFESVFIAMMLKSMRESMSQEMFAGDGSDTFGGMFDSFMGQHIARAGGIGLSTMLDSTQLDLATRKPVGAPDAVTSQAQREIYQHAASIS